MLNNKLFSLASRYIESRPEYVYLIPDSKAIGFRDELENIVSIYMLGSVF